MSTSQKSAPRRSVVKKIAKIAGIVVGTIILLFLIAVAIGPYLIPTSAVERIISKNTQQDLGRPAKIDDVSVSLIAGVKMTVTNLEISDKPEYGDRPLLKIGRVVLDADLLPLLGKRRLVVNKLSIEHPEVSVVKAKDGRYNVMDVPPRPPEKPEKEKEPAEPQELPSFKISNFSLSDGSLTLTDLATQETQKIGSITAELSAEADPSRGQADIAKATLSFDGFNASAKGKVEQQNGATVVKDFRVDSAINLNKLGPRFAAVLPVNMSGDSEYHVSLDGPITELKTKVDFTLSGFELTGAKLRKPARIDNLQVRKTAVLNLEQMTAPSFVSETKSDSLGLELKVSGKMGNIRRGGAVDIAMSGKADLGKLADFANSFTAKPVRAEGMATGEGTIVGDPSRELVAKGKGEITNLLFEGPGMPKPYTEERVSLAYEVAARERKSFAIKEFSLTSNLLNAQASGTVSAETADLKANAQADLSQASALLAGMGLLPEGTSFGGKLAGNLGAKNVEGGVEGTIESTIRNFFVVSPLLKERYAEDEVKLSGSALVGIANGTAETVSNTRFALKSKLADVSGTVSTVQLAQPAEIKMDADVNADLSPIGDLLVVMEYLEKGTSMKGRVQGTIALSLLPEKKEQQQGAKRVIREKLNDVVLNPCSLFPVPCSSFVSSSPSSSSFSSCVDSSSLITLEKQETTIREQGTRNKEQGTRNRDDKRGIDLVFAGNQLRCWAPLRRRPRRVATRSASRMSRCCPSLPTGSR
ncbi:MAG TPA: AsmA family protein [Planctomycetota bacterium]|nr:AsmA family protein [Planctomycetota bacterium]